MHQLTGAGLPLTTTTARYDEHLRVPAMSVGTYTIPVGSPDPQQPHAEDEIYVVTAGRARLWSAEAVVEACPGVVLFVAAGQEHRFIDVVEALTVLVIFAPAES